MRHIYQKFGLHELELKGPVNSVYAKIEERSGIWNSVIPWEGLRLKCSTMRAVCNTYMEKKDKYPNNYSQKARPWRPVCSVYGKMRNIYQNVGLQELELQGPVFSVYAKIKEKSVILNSVIPWEGLRIKCSSKKGCVQHIYGKERQIPK